jgi:hypothetical protein
MYYPNEFRVKFNRDGARHVLLCEEGEVNQHYEKKNSYKLMVWTTQKDKNRRDIYEDDVIEYKGKTDAMHIGRIRSVVEWEERRSGFYPMTAWYAQGDDEVEIVSNIHETVDKRLQN